MTDLSPIAAPSPTATAPEQRSVDLPFLRLQSKGVVAGNASARWLFPVLLLLLFWLIRTHELLRLPLFLDEASHLTRAQWVWEGQPFYLLETGKALGPYLAAALWPYAEAPFVGRIVVVLLGLIGIAAAFAVGKALHSREVGLLTMALWIAAPQLMFFERMALVDASMASMALLALWFALRMLRAKQTAATSWAILCGVGLALTVLAKLTGLVYLPIPAAVAILVGCGSWRWRLRQVVIAYAAFGLLIAPMVLYLYSRGEAVDPTGQSSGLTSTEASSIGERVSRNLPRMLNAQRVYFGEGALWVCGLASVAALIAMPRRTLLLWAQVAIPVAAIAVTAQQLWLRYLSPLAPFLLMVTVLGVVQIARWMWPEQPRLVRWMPRLLVVTWALIVGVPFQLTAYRDPSQLPLPGGDRFEYLEWIPSGYGIRDAAEFLNATITEPITVIGSAVNCNAARLYLRPDSPVTLLCPSLHWGGDNPHIVADMRARLARDGVLYVLSEDKSPPTIDMQLFRERTEIASFPRPTFRNTVRFYRLTFPR